MSSRSTSNPSAARRPRRRTDAASAGQSADKQAARERLIALTRLLDSAFEVPALRTRVGLDALLGLVPVIGDVVSGALGLYLVLEARRLGASRWLQARMIGNLLFDSALGAVPVAGDLFDIYFKAHRRNLNLLQKELGEPFIDGVHSRDRDVIDVEPAEARLVRPLR
jgi:hypothetical protein